MALHEKKAKTAVLVSGGGTNLQAIIDAERSGKLPHVELSAVISNNPDAYALKRASAAGIKTFVVNRDGEFESRIISIMENEKIDLIVLAGFMCILSKDFTSRFPKRILNVHPSLIPSFCGKGFYGLKVHEAALEYGVKVTGATVHFVNEVPDGGEIILQKAVNIRKGDTPKILQRRVMEKAEWKILPQALEIVAKEYLK